MAEDKRETEPEVHDITSLDTYTLLNFFLGIIAEKAWQNLGLRVKPGADKTEVDLGQAETAIDVGSLLFEKLKPHLPESDSKKLEGMISDLKLNYIRIKK